MDAKVKAEVEEALFCDECELAPAQWLWFREHRKSKRVSDYSYRVFCEACVLEWIKDGNAKPGELEKLDV